MALNVNDYPYLRQKLMDEEARRHSRHDSAATIRAAVSFCSTFLLVLLEHGLGLFVRLTMSQHIEDVRTAAVMPVPSKDNDWLGFCMHAVKLQNGDKKVSCSDRRTKDARQKMLMVNDIGCS